MSHVNSAPFLFALLALAPQARAQTFSTIYNFTGEPNSAAGSFVPLTVGGGGVLYGSTYSSVYSLTPPASPGGVWTAATLAVFTDADGVEFPSGLVVGPGGVLYGTTQFGGSNSCQVAFCGTVFSLTPPSSPDGSWTQELRSTTSKRAEVMALSPPGSVAIGHTPGGRLALYRHH